MPFRPKRIARFKRKIWRFLTGLATNNLKMSKWLEETTPAEPDLFFSSNWNWTLVNPLSTNKVKTGRQSYGKLSRPLHPLQTGQAGILRTCDRV